MKRFYEIDALRGAAIIFMVAYHVIYDLSLFGKLGLDMMHGTWKTVACIIASMFLILVGVSLSLSFSSKGSGFDRYLFRGLKIFGIGLLITAFARALYGDWAIVFGVLHLIGVSIIISYPFLKRKWLALVAGGACIAAGIFVSKITIDSSWLAWLGVTPKTYMYFDYYPLLPWFGLVLIGIFVGNTLYKNYKRQFRILDLEKNFVAKGLGFLGRHSLVIYLLQQPILLLVLQILGLIKFF